MLVIVIPDLNSEVNERYHDRVVHDGTSGLIPYRIVHRLLGHLLKGISIISENVVLF